MVFLGAETLFLLEFTLQRAHHIVVVGKVRLDTQVLCEIAALAIADVHFFVAVRLVVSVDVGIAA